MGKVEVIAPWDLAELHICQPHIYKKVGCKAE